MLWTFSLSMLFRWNFLFFKSTSILPRQLDRSTRVLLESFIPVCCLIAYFFLLLFYYVAIFVLNSSFPFPKAAHKAILALVVVVMMACMLTVLVVLTESLTYPFSFSFVLWLPSLNLLCSPWQQSLIQISYLQVSLLLQRCGSRRRSWLFGCYYSYLSWYSCMHLLLSVYWIDHLFHCSLQGLQEGRMEISQCLFWSRSFLHSSCLLSLWVQGRWRSYSHQ